MVLLYLIILENRPHPYQFWKILNEKRQPEWPGVTPLTGDITICHYITIGINPVMALNIGNGGDYNLIFFIHVSYINSVKVILIIISNRDFPTL